METYPSCFESESDYNLWLESAEEEGIDNPEYNFCISCTPEFQAIAKRLGVCGSPQTFFVPILNEDGETELIGIRP